MRSNLHRFELVLYNWAGQWFPDSRQNDLKLALDESSKKFGYADRIDDFLAYLEANPPQSVKDAVVQSVLVGETYFFRDDQLWDSLRDEILPDIIEKKRQSRNIRIWSAGCSSGEEVYSLALTIKEFMPDLSGWNINILGTDISDASLAKARQGSYSARSTNGVGDLLKAKWFEEDGGSLKIKQEIKNMVSFSRMNLCDLRFPNYLTASTDLLLCRNVLIYLEKDYVAKVIEHFTKCLAPEGWLILAPTEIPFDLPQNLRLQHMKSRLITLRIRHNKSQSAYDGLPDHSNIKRLFSQSYEGSLDSLSFTPLYGTDEISFPHIFSTQTELNLTSAPQSLNGQLQTAPVFEFNGSDETSDTSGTNEGQTLNAYAAHDSQRKSGIQQIPAEENGSSSFEAEPDLSSATADPLSIRSASNSQNAALDFSLKARKYADKGNLSAALIAATQSIDACPTYIGAWLVLALIQEELERYDDAADSLNKAIYINPENALSYLQMARVLYRRRSGDAAHYLDIFNSLTADMKDEELLPYGNGLSLGAAKALARTLNIDTAANRPYGQV